MLLIISNTKDATVDHLVPHLIKSSVPHLRFDTDICLSKSLLSFEDGKVVLEYDGVAYSPDVFTGVWHRRPESLLSPDMTPEESFTVNEWAEMFENFFAMIPEESWINHPVNNARASHKIHQLCVAKSLGMNVPDSLVTMSEKHFSNFFEQHDGRVIVKPLYSGYVNRRGSGNDSLIYTNRISKSYLDKIREVKSCPTLFQEEISKKADVRITVLDDCIVAVKMIPPVCDCPPSVDIRVNNMQGIAYSPIDIPVCVRRGVTSLMKYYSLRFAAIDMIVDCQDTWFFLEVNPNGQWAWLDQDAGTGIAGFFIDVLTRK